MLFDLHVSHSMLMSLASIRSNISVVVVFSMTDRSLIYIAQENETKSFLLTMNMGNFNNPAPNFQIP